MCVLLVCKCYSYQFKKQIKLNNFFYDNEIGKQKDTTFLYRQGVYEVFINTCIILSLLTFYCIMDTAISSHRFQTEFF